MVVIVKKKSGSTFSIKADTWETVLDIKKKIETYQGIPVSNQMLYLRSTLLRDDLDLKHYKIVKKSKLHLFFSPDLRPFNNEQVLHQTEQSLVPSKSSTEISYIEDSPEEIIQNQDSTVTARSNDGDLVINQTEKPLITEDEMDELLSMPESPLTAEDIRKILESWRRNSNNQDFLLRETSPTSKLTGAFMYGEIKPWTTEDGFCPVTIEENVNVRSNNYYQDLLLRESSSPPSNLVGGFVYGGVKPLSTERFTKTQPSNSTEQRINTQDVTVNVGSSNQTEKSPLIKEVVNIQDSSVKMIRRAKKYPRKMSLMVLLYSRESKAVEKFPVDVNAFENVQELREVLEEIQRERSELNLPEKGYLFIHKRRVLEEDQSFWGNNVVHGDTIVIVPRSKDRIVRKSGR